MEKIVFHIGMHKTGSTSIQNVLAGLRNDSVEYLELPAIDPDLSSEASNHSFPLMLGFSSNYLSFPALVRLGLTASEIGHRREYFRDLFFSALEQCSAHTAVISAEAALSIDQAGLIELERILRRHASDVQLYAYVREPLGYIKSITNQVIRWGYVGDKPHVRSYRKDLEPVERVFGRENVHYRIFDRNRFPNGSVVDDFVSWTGIPVHALASVEANMSLSTEATRCVHALNRSNMPTQGDRMLVGARRSLLKWLADTFPGRFDLPDALVDSEVEVQDLRWMEERLGHSMLLRPLGKSEACSDDLKGFLSRIEPASRDVLTAELSRRLPPVAGGATVTDLMEQLYLEHLREVGSAEYDYRLFNGGRYLSLHPDVKAAGVHPFGHYLLWGRTEGRLL